MNSIEKVKEKLEALRLNAMAENLPIALDQEKNKNKGTCWVFEYLLDKEIEKKHQRAINTRFRQSKLFDQFTIDQFDFNFHSSRKKNRPRIMQLMELEFIDAHKDIIFIGNPGRGKTFLSKIIGYAGCQANKKVLYTTAINMINNLIAAQADQSLLKKLHYYQAPSLLICDELGYLPLDQQGSNLFFQVISARHGRSSTIITTNLAFSDWGKIFDNSSVAVAVADRLVANSEIMLMEGNSYRRKNK